MFDGKIRFHGEESGERVAFLLRKLATEAVFLEDGIALLWRHFAEVAEGACNEAATVLRKAAELSQSAYHLLPLWRCQMLHGFSAVNHATPLLGRHIVKLRETVAHTLLSLRRKVAEARLVFQGALLVRQRKIAVTIHPLGQVLLILLRTGNWSRSRLTDANTCSRSCSRC